MKKNIKKNIVIIHYNTPYLTECLIRSINLFVKDVIIYIFDNSDENPFTAKFDNVTVLDNTKGQIINFDKWLEKYPNRTLSSEATKTFGSAKHCYTVEKCMELVDDNFILLDSDVLLKKDISELYDNKYIYSGEIAVQPHVSIKRVLPFICFINVNMCKKNNVHYFDENYMHGLYKSRQSDMYDTGAGFYINANKYKHNEIKCEDYVVHYGHGSWNKKGYVYKFTQNDWLNINKRYWSEEKNKKVVYTCITGGYDKLLEPKIISEGFDYVCFTDNDNLKSDIWDIRKIPHEIDDLSIVKQQRYVKLNPHLLLSDYDISIWVDGNISLNGDLNEFIEENMEDDINIYVPKHPQRNCIYKEAVAVVKLKKDVSDIVDKQINKYKEEGFPEDYGLLQSNILLRKHNEKDCIKLMEDWFNELKDNSHRDQLSFNYALWKNSSIKIKYLDKKIYNSTWFFWHSSHTNHTVIKSRKVSMHEKKAISTYELNIY